MQWLTDRIDGMFRAWEQKELTRREAEKPKDRIIVRMWLGHPCALFLDQTVGNDKHLVYCVITQKSAVSLRLFLDQNTPVGEKDAPAVSTLLTELRRIGYNPVVFTGDVMGLL